jgi:hypothetical protein
MLNAQSRRAVPRPADGTGSPDPRRWLMLPVVLMAMFMAGFEVKPFS